MSFARTATWGAAIEGLNPQGDAQVLLGDVLRQRKAFVDFSAKAQYSLPLPDFLAGAARCAATGCNAPMSKVLELRRSDNMLIVKAQWGLLPEKVGDSAGTAEPGNPPGQALTTARPYVVTDMRVRPPAEIPVIFREFNVVSSVNIPLIGREGPYGILEVDYQEPHEPDELEISFLASIAGVIAEGIERMQEREALAADRDLKAVLLREQQHRIRNNFQLITGLLQYNERATADTKAKQHFKDVARRVFALVSLYDHLLGQDQQGAKVDLSHYLASLCDNFRAFHNLDDLKIALACSEKTGVMVDIDVGTALGTAVNELLANAVEHAFEGEPGALQVSFQYDEGQPYIITVQDNGIGLPAELRESTGLTSARRLLSGIGGKLDSYTNPGRGTTWTISIPPVANGMTPS